MYSPPESREGYPSTALDVEKSLDPMSDLDTILQATNQFLGHDRYASHHERMIDLLERYDLSTPGMEMAVALHDVVDHGLINSSDEQRYVQAADMMYGLYDKVEDKDGFLYALGCAISTGYWEDEIGEGWRNTGAQAFEHMSIDERRQIIAGIRHDKSVEIDEHVLKSAKPDDIGIDTSALRNAMRERDVEGLIIKAVELMDNLDNPPPNNPASIWRDCVEIVRCYGPALELFGFNELAMDLRSKALEYFYSEDEETVEKASRQYEPSQKYFDFASDAAESVIREVLRNMPELENLYKQSSLLKRVKTYGSLLEKFHDDDYVTANLVPDGIGLRLILPDHVSREQLITIAEQINTLFTESWMEDGPEPEFLARHPVDASPVDDRITTPKPSGYSAIHIALQYRTIEEGAPVTVPVEVQLVRESQERLHTYDKASHVLYKGGTEFTEEVKDDLRQIEMRAEHLRNKPFNQELNPHTWFDMVKLLPELGSPIHDAYRLVTTPKARLLVPHELEAMVAESLAESELQGDIFLPPARLSLDNFSRLVGLIDPSLKDDEQIQEALDLLVSEKLPKRRGGTGQLEGHLLPVAFHAGLLASVSALHWEEADPSQALSDTITQGLLHDVIEDIGHGRKKRLQAKMKARIKTLIRSQFGDINADVIEAMTSPEEIEDEHERRAAYTAQLTAVPAALLRKISDRDANHITDLVKLAKPNVDQKTIDDSKRYLKKTRRYLSENFSNAAVPEEYRQTHKAVMEMGEVLFPDILYS